MRFQKKNRNFEWMIIWLTFKILTLLFEQFKSEIQIQMNLNDYLTLLDMRVVLFHIWDAWYFCSFRKRIEEPIELIWIMV